MRRASSDAHASTVSRPDNFLVVSLMLLAHAHTVAPALTPGQLFDCETSVPSVCFDRGMQKRSDGKNGTLGSGDAYANCAWEITTMTCSNATREDGPFAQHCWPDLELKDDTGNDGTTLLYGFGPAPTPHQSVPPH